MLIREATGLRAWRSNGDMQVVAATSASVIAMADLRLLGPYITEVLEVVGGSSLFCQFGVGAAWWPENRGFAPLYRGARARFSGPSSFWTLTFKRVFLVTRIWSDVKYF